MDGKQRLSTVKEFLNDEFSLTNLDPVTYLDDETNEECVQDISGMKFSELPESLQNYLNTVIFSVTYFDNLTKEEERELFKRLNAGKPLSTKSRLLASCKDIEGLLNIGSHKLFEEMLTDKAKDNKNQVAIVMKSWCMMNQSIDTVSFESKVFNTLLEETEITEAEKLKMINVFNLIVDTHSTLINYNEKKVAKKLYTETHFVSLIPYFCKAVENNINCNMMADWVVDFFGVKDTASISEEYNNACTGGSAKNANILSRHNALEKSYAEFFNTDDSIDIEEAFLELVDEDLKDTEDENVENVNDDLDKTEVSNDHKSFINDIMSYVKLADDE